MKNSAKLGLGEFSPEHLDYFKQFYNPNLIPNSTSPYSQVHHLRATQKALEIINWMVEKEVGLVIFEPDLKEDRRELEKPLLKDMIKDPPFEAKLPKDAMMIQHYPLHLTSLKLISKTHAVFILDPLRTLYLSFNEVVNDLYPPHKEDIYVLSKVFNIPYEDWFLATILSKLEPDQVQWMLDHLETPFVSSISSQHHVLLKPIESHQMDEYKNQSIIFNFHFRYQEEA